MSQAERPKAGSLDVTVGPPGVGGGGLDETVPPADIQPPAPSTHTARRSPDETVDPSDTSNQSLATVDFTPTPPGLSPTIASIPDRPSAGRGGPPAAPGPKVEGYDVLSELGRGGMGVVYKARQIKLNRTVALKMVLAGAHAGAEQLARFYTEAEAVAHLQQSNIVQIYEVGEHDRLPYFSLEFVDGGSLAERIGGKPQPVTEAAQQVELLARAMAYAHERGVIHRDLKPANVLLTRDGQPKITDFGLAKRLESDSSQTKSGTLMGTPNYMAPEQARGEVREVGPLADVYALGVILYEMLTGRTPFLGASILDTLQQVRNQEPVPPSHLQPKVPRDLETICLKCLQKDPSKRYDTAEALADDLRRFRAGEPIRARRVSRVERAWRWCKRNPRIAALSTAVGVLLIISAVALTGMQLRAWRDREASLATGKMARERLKQAGEAMEAGEFRRAQDLLRWSDALLEQSPTLADVRSELALYRDQVNLYAQFKDLLDQSRYYGLPDAPELRQEALKYCRQFLALCQEIESKSGRGACGMPRFTPEQQEMFTEDLFEGFLVAGKVEWDETTARQDRPAQIEAAKQAIARYDRLEKLLPPTKTLHSRRHGFWTMLGRLEMDPAAREAAEKDAQRAEEITPTSPIDRFWHGFAEQLRGDRQARQGDGTRAREFFQSAIGEYVALLHMRPGHFWAYYYYALAHYQRREFHDAIVGYTACIHISPERPWPYYRRALAYHELKQYDLALLDFELALARNNQDAEVYGKRGESYLAMGNVAAGLADLDQAVKLRPNQIDVYFWRGKAYRDLGRHDQAVADFDRALRLNPASPDVLYHRGLAYQAQRKADLALADFDAAIAARPLYLPPAYQKISVCCGLLRYDDALTECQRLLKLKADDPRAHAAAAHIYHRQGRFDEALAALNMVLQKLAPNSPVILNQRADVQRSMGKLAAASADWRQSVQRAPKQIDAYLGLAAVSQEQGNTQQADEWLAKMIEADPQSAAPYLRRAEVLRSRGQLDAATADGDRAAELDLQSVNDDLFRTGVDALRGNAGQAVEAAESLLAKAPDDDGQAVYSAVCTFVLAAEAASRESGSSESSNATKKYLDRAAALLADLLGPGPYRMSPQEYSRWVSDRTLDPLRSHLLVEKFLPANSPRE